MLWVKAIHVIAVISWMAGLLYLPRLLIYHCQSEKGSKQSETFKIMEAKLLRIIMAPASVITWITGLILAYLQDFWFEPWFLVKFTSVILMTIFYHYLIRWVRAFANDKNQKSEKYYRIANEVPTLLMILIVIMVIVKPF